MNFQDAAVTIKQHIVDNLLFLHDRVPENTRQRSKLWYDGANKISNDLYSIGYSGDFYKPDKVISVDHLIIDGSVAGIFRQRKFSREESIEALRSLISNNIGRVPIIIKAHSGLLEKIYYWISDVLRNIPRICDDKFYRSLEIHSDFGYEQINNIYKRGDSAGIEILKSNKYIRFLRQKEDSYGLEDKFIINCNRTSC